MIQIPTLEPLDSLIPASYNPRKVDPRRLELVRLSLRKLGWLLPIYACENGEILSGHQRAFVAREIGYRHVPVVRVPDLPEQIRKAVNVVFNRATNDIEMRFVPSDAARKVLRAEVHDSGGRLSDHPTDDFPCLSPSVEPIDPFLRANSGRWMIYPYNVAKTLFGHGVLMPIVVEDGTMRVVNGIGRLQMLAEKRVANAAFVSISPEKAAFASLMLNALSMDFDLHTRYADLLRHNSFRRSRHKREYLGCGFTFWAGSGGRTKDFDFFEADDRARWINIHGRTVLDFGAGHLHETRILRAGGIDVTPFEPYHLFPKREEIDKAKSLTLAREFLEAVAAGKWWHSIFVSSVLNSVPFRADREHIVRICAACASSETALYVTTMSKAATTYTAQFSQYLSQRQASYCHTPLDYEPGILLGSIDENPKVQKFHDPEELHGLLRSAFGRVRVTAADHNLYGQAADPLELDAARLRSALEFEFDLPYPDGSRMGLVPEALAAFEKRLQTRL